MKYIKTFEQFINEKYNYSDLTEAHKWTKEAVKSLNSFATRFPKMVEGEYDPKTARVSSAIMDAITLNNTLLILGDAVWKIQNEDKTEIKNWNGTSWESSDDADSAKTYIEATKKYLELEKSAWELVIKFISAVEKGNANVIGGLVNNLEATSDKAYKANKKWQKLMVRPVIKEKYRDEADSFKREFHDNMLKKAIKTTSNEKAIEALRKKLKG